jgi:hypothetical protein
MSEALARPPAYARTRLIDCSMKVRYSPALMVVQNPNRHWN